MTAQFEPAPRIVRPRVKQYKFHPVLAVHGDQAVHEHGEAWTCRELTDLLPKLASTLFACVGAADLVGHFNTVYLLRDPDHWQWRTSVHERDIIGPDGRRQATRVNVIIHYFGFKGGNYHKIIDPISLSGRRLDEIWPGDKPQLVRLLEWAIALRDFCQENNLDVRPTNGGISSQLLTDPRFYPADRRKVPAATNRSVRERLPGNYYYLNVRPKSDREYTAHYLDQHRAHHYHARHTALPASDHLYAYGRFQDLARIAFCDTNPKFHGLYCLDMEYSGGSAGQRAFHWLGPGPYEKAFVYSNELTHLLDMGFRVTGVRAAWGSTHRDAGLARYACWCEEQLDKYGDAKWLKPLLLSAYGTLATKPKYAESVFRLATSGEPVTVMTGKHRLVGRHAKGKVKLEPRIANVLHRGMIEAATRSESVGFAQHVESMGHQVLSIYADAVIVRADDDNPLPELWQPWEVKHTLNHLRFLNQQSFTSGELTKLPGVSREAILFNRPRTGHAPRKPMYNIFTGQRLTRQEAVMFGINPDKRI